MATLPTEADVGRVAPNPSRGVASYNAGQVEDAQIASGNALARLGENISVMAANETAKLDNLKVDDKLTQLMAYELDATKKYKEVKAGGVLDPNYHKSSQDEYNAKIADLTGDLTDAQKSKFDNAAKRRAVQFDAERYGYATHEADNYHVTEYKARTDVLAETGASNYQDAAKLAETSLGVDIATGKELARRGYTDPADPVVKDELGKARANFWGSVLDRAITDGDTQSANSIYASAKGMLNNEQRKAFESRMKPANDFAEGQKLAVEAHDMLAKGKSMDEIELTLTQKATTPGAYNAAQTIFTNFQQAAAKQQAENVGTVNEMFLSTGGNTAAMQHVLASPEYGKLPADQRGHVLNFMQDEVYQQSQRARAAVIDKRQDISWQQSQADRAESKRKEAQGFKGMETFLTTLENPNFATMSRAQIYNLAPQVGKDGVMKLLGEQANLVNGAKRFQIDKDILDAAVPEELLKSGNKDKLNAFKGFVESTLMDWKAANPGKQPSPDEQRKIANSANAKWVDVKNWWPDKEYKAYEGPPDKWVKQLTDAAARKGKTLTQDQINAAWRKQSLQGQ